MNHGSALQKLSGGVHKGGELLDDPVAGPQDRPFAHDRPEEIGAHLTHPAQRESLVLVERGERAEKSESVLGGCRDTRRSRSGDRRLAGGTADFGQTVFRHHKAGLWEIRDLSSFMPSDRKVGEIFSAGVARHGSLHPQEGVAFVAGLAPGFLS